MQAIAQVMQDRRQDVENHQDAEQHDETVPADDSLRSRLRLHGASPVLMRLAAVTPGAAAGGDAAKRAERRALSLTELALEVAGDQLDREKVAEVPHVGVLLEPAQVGEGMCARNSVRPSSVT